MSLITASSAARCAPDGGMHNPMAECMTHPRRMRECITLWAACVPARREAPRIARPAATRARSAPRCGCAAGRARARSARETAAVLRARPRPAATPAPRQSDPQTPPPPPPSRATGTRAGCLRGRLRTSLTPGMPWMPPCHLHSPPLTWRGRVSVSCQQVPCMIDRTAVSETHVIHPLRTRSSRTPRCAA